MVEVINRQIIVYFNKTFPQKSKSHYFGFYHAVNYFVAIMFIFFKLTLNPELNCHYNKATENRIPYRNNTDLRTDGGQFSKI